MRLPDRAAPSVAGLVNGEILLFGGRDRTDLSRGRSDGARVRLDTGETKEVPGAPFDGQIVKSVATTSPTGDMIVAAVLCRGSVVNSEDAFRCGTVDVASARLSVDGNRWERLADPVRPFKPSGAFEAPALWFVEGSEGTPILRYINDETKESLLLNLDSDEWTALPEPPSLDAVICRTGTRLVALAFGEVSGQPDPATQGPTEGRPFGVWNLDGGEWSLQEANGLDPAASGVEEPMLGCDDGGAYLVQAQLEDRSVEIIPTQSDGPRRTVSGIGGLPTGLQSSPNGIALTVGSDVAAFAPHGSTTARVVRGVAPGSQLVTDGRRSVLVGNEDLETGRLRVVPVAE